MLSVNPSQDPKLRSFWATLDKYWGGEQGSGEEDGGQPTPQEPQALLAIEDTQPLLVNDKSTALEVSESDDEPEIARQDGYECPVQALQLDSPETPEASDPQPAEPMSSSRHLSEAERHQILERITLLRLGQG